MSKKCHYNIPVYNCWIPPFKTIPTSPDIPPSGLFVIESGSGIIPVPPDTAEIVYLITGGGGGGAGISVTTGGGGGAGGGRSDPTSAIVAVPILAPTDVALLSYSVGEGGDGGAPDQAGEDGDASTLSFTINAVNIFSVTALGGGGGIPSDFGGEGGNGGYYAGGGGGGVGATLTFPSQSGGPGAPAGPAGGEAGEAGEAGGDFIGGAGGKGGNGTSAEIFDEIVDVVPFSGVGIGGIEGPGEASVSFPRGGGGGGAGGVGAANPAIKGEDGGRESSGKGGTGYGAGGGGNVEPESRVPLKRGKGANGVVAVYLRKS